LLREHSKVFKIIYTNCPGKRLSEKVIVRETSCTGNSRQVREANVRETSFRERPCPGNFK